MNPLDADYLVPCTSISTTCVHHPVLCCANAFSTEAAKWLFRRVSATLRASIYRRLFRVDDADRYVDIGRKIVLTIKGVPVGT